MLQSYVYEQVLPQLEGVVSRYSPKLLINNPRTRENVLNEIIQELNACKSFMIIVAFVTESGLATLKTQLFDLKRRGIKGKLLTSTYLNFNHPKVFRELLKIENLEVRLSDLEGFHSKGYIFDAHEDFALIIGSTNLTANALKVNYEWNVKLRLLPTEYFIKQIRNQFESVWQNSVALTEEWIKGYEVSYVQYAAKQVVQEELALVKQRFEASSVLTAKIEPNKMQTSALNNIKILREQGQQKGLIISATGTGKTFLAAFDVRSYKPKRILFIAHREQILIKSKSDFIKVVGGDESDYGLLSGSNKDLDTKHLFSTIQTISKSDVLSQFSPDEFDYILIDEVHKAGASSYQKVIDYFKPKFLMGMTATPERTDEFNIYQLFDYNVAYEIRLQAALEEDMLCPFNYFGVTDFEKDGEMVDDTTVLAKLVTNERVDHIIEKIEYYGYSGTQVRGLMFVSRKEEAIDLSFLLNDRGYRTVALTGDDSIEHRERQIKALEQGELEYIITVDIFNEGIDIPSVNQVVMLRQTQSSIIFIQQLGRGLRKHNSKEFVTIIDFIGNYKNNYLIPIALSGDKSLNKDNIRRHMKDSSYIQGVSTINFEEVAKSLIYKSISNNNLTEFKKLRDEFVELKNRLGRRPYLYDFVMNNSIDPEVIVKNHENYQKFLERLKEDVPSLTDYECKVLTMISNELMNGKRHHEIILLELLLERGVISKEEFTLQLQTEGCRVDQATLSSVRNVMELSFFVQANQAKYGGHPICNYNLDGSIYFSETLRNRLIVNEHFKEMFVDVIRVAREKATDYNPLKPLTLHRKYTRKEVCKLLNWENDESSTVYGYKTKHQTCPIFVTYHKHEEVESSIDYSDELLDPTTFKWFTRSNRTLQSDEVQKIIEAKRNNIDIHILVKKDDDEGSDFYYLGQATPDMATVHQTTMAGKKEGETLPVVCMNMLLEHAVDNKLYQYLKSSGV
ncbi:DEAD/DEAH box helicase [Paenibacillus glycanilyticus]|nr:DEAD/DEAH box helicase [Paenibacillus glycanilyticus]MCM3630230.1 DEAD/DEAH box helicase [Paenibacillus glycanilyticus]